MKHLLTQCRAYHAVHHTLITYCNSHNEKQKEALRQQLIEKSSELESVKSTYLLKEKIVLSVWNSGKLQSPIMITIVHLLLTELRSSYQAICELRQELNEQLGELIVTSFKSPLEVDIRKDILKTLGTSVEVYLQDSSEVLDTSELRQLICDFAGLIRYFEQEQYKLADKKVVRDYLEREFQIKSSHFKCTNCGDYLLKDIPYCLNCYERNEE